MMDLIHSYLQLIANALLLPTLLMMLLLTGWTVILSGGLLREGLLRPRVRRQLREALRLARSEGPPGSPAAMASLALSPGGLPRRFCTLLDDGRLESADWLKALEDVESDVASSLAQLTWLTRVAPMLGLMGTLIPLGPALTGLAAGDMAMLSGNLVVAFTATVIGVLIGSVAFTLGLVRRNWYQRDMSDLEHLHARLHRDSSPACER